MTVPGRPTIDELFMVREMLVLPNIVTMLERQRQEMEYSSMMLKPLYLRSVDALIFAVNRDLSNTRMELQQRKIKTWEGDHNEFTLCVEFMCRGYRDKFEIVREYLKSVIRERLTEYIKEMGEALSDHISNREYKPPKQPKELKTIPGE